MGTEIMGTIMGDNHGDRRDVSPLERPVWPRFLTVPGFSPYRLILDFDRITTEEAAPRLCHPERSCFSGVAKSLP